MGFESRGVWIVLGAWNVRFTRQDTMDRLDPAAYRGRRRHSRDPSDHGGVAGYTGFTDCFDKTDKNCLTLGGALGILDGLGPSFGGRTDLGLRGTLGQLGSASGPSPYHGLAAELARVV